MPEQQGSPFAHYLQEIDAMLKGLPAAQRAAIEQELRAHLEDAAAERDLSADDAALQREVIEALGPSLELGMELYEANANKVGAAKRLFDIALATCLLTIFMPFLVVVAMLIRIDSRGPIFYREQRLGKRGRPYTMYKFRTIEHRSQVGKRRRVTRVGRCLRRTSLDELPQLFNVLRGDMSLTGPRPLKPDDAVTNEMVRRRVLLLQPGVCCPSHIVFGSRPIEVAKRLEIDAGYVEQRSFRYDVRLLRRTLWLAVNIMWHRI